MSIFGIGIDRVLLARIAAASARWGERFARKVLGPGEWSIYSQRLHMHPQRAVQFLATRFAAKEAFAKAMGIGLRSPMCMPHLEVLNDGCGKPLAVAHGDLQAWLSAHQLRAHVSLSDETDAALAMVLLERVESTPAQARKALREGGKTASGLQGRASG